MQVGSSPTESVKSVQLNSPFDSCAYLSKGASNIDQFEVCLQDSNADGAVETLEVRLASAPGAFWDQN